MTEPTTTSDSAQTLLEAGSDLLHAAQTKSAKEVEVLLKDKEAPVWYQDESGWSSLHYAAEREDLAMIKVLLKHGAVWNAVDNQGLCPSDISLSLNSPKCYTTITSHAARSEFLLGVLADKKKADSMDEAGEGEEADAADGHLILKDGEKDTTAGSTDLFLKSKLTYLSDDDGRERVVDEEGNGVMMGWESGIMEKTVRVLTKDMEGVENDEGRKGLRILNVGFGLGIIDTMFQNLDPPPLLHVVIEPHFSVLEHMDKNGWTREAKPNFRVLKGKWQEAVEMEEIYEEGGFDIIYFDTFSEGYEELKAFFQHLPNLLAGPSSRFSFFHGLGATNMSFHDVYTSLSELHLREVGIGAVEWHDLRMKEEVREEVWKGVRRSYWNLPFARIPVASMDM